MKASSRFFQVIGAVTIFSAISANSQYWTYQMNSPAGVPISAYKNIPSGTNYGNILVASNRFTTAGDTAVLFLGNESHYIKSTYGGGVRIGTYGAGNAIQLQEATGNVGIGTTNPASKLQIAGSIGMKVKTATGSATYNCGDETVILLNFTPPPGISNGNIVLPSAASCPGRVYFIKQTSTVPAILSTCGGNLFDGGPYSGFGINTKGQSIIVASDGGNNWWILKSL
jgi:hypothetical protein